MSFAFFSSIGQRMRNGHRTIAILEGAKGFLVLAVGFGLLGLLHRDVQGIALHVVNLLHLNPAKHFAGVFLRVASQVNDSRLWMFAGIAFIYSAGRLIEAYGLWKQRTWAEWFALVAGAVYL